MTFQVRKLFSRINDIFMRIVCFRIVYLTAAIFDLPRMRYYCPLCEKEVWKWEPFSRDIGNGRFRLEPEGRLCPHCHCFERTRHFWLYLQQNGILDSRPFFLHFAPEYGLQKRLKVILGDRYKTIDLSMPGVDLKENVTSLTIADNSFDIIYCSNVLEHIEDDYSAMKELFRVLAPGGTAIIQVPIRGALTDEDPTVTSPTQRAERFGQSDHVRYYGCDIRNRLKAVGFRVEEIYMPDSLGLKHDDVVRMNLNKEELIHFCYKPRR